MTLLNVTDLSIHFGGVKAVQNVSFSIEAGIVYAVIGPNGAGKTTLFNLITGFTPLSSGTIRFDDADVSQLKSFAVARLGVARTFQNLRVMPGLSVFDNVSIGALGELGHSPWSALFARRSRAEDISRRTWEALERAGL